MRRCKKENEFRETHILLVQSMKSVGRKGLMYNMCNGAIKQDRLPNIGRKVKRATWNESLVKGCSKHVGILVHVRLCVWML